MPFLSNFHVSLSLECLFRFTKASYWWRPLSTSNSHWNNSRLHWKFHIHSQPSQNLQYAIKHSFLFDKEYNLGKYSLSLPHWVQMSSQNLVCLPYPTSIRIPWDIELNNLSFSMKLHIWYQTPPFRFICCTFSGLSWSILWQEHTIFFHNGHSSLAKCHYHLKSRVEFLITRSPTPKPHIDFGF